VVALAVVGAIAAWRYLPAVDSARTLADRASALAAEMRSMGVEDLDEARVADLTSKLDAMEGDLAPIRELLAGDPLVGLARALPFTGPQVTGADAVVAAATGVLAAGDIGMGVGERFTAIRGQQATGGSGMLPQLVGLLADSTDEIDRMGDHLDAALVALARVPDEVVGPIARARDEIQGPLERYGPLVTELRAADDVLPDILGWREPRRYLVLAQDPAELRPGGGYSGTIGIIAFEGGALTERRFFDVYTLDTKRGLPYVEPPEALRDHLLGDLPWQLADANWAADWPTAAQDALRLYTLESGDEDIDGVIAITTYALDRILRVIGPVEVPEYDTVVRPGQVTMIGLRLTRSSDDPDTNRKEFLNVLATTTLQRLFGMPPEQWMPLVQQMQDVGEERLAMAWFADPDAQALMERIGWDGKVRQDAGDYVYAIDSNVAPTSKYNLVVERRSLLNVELGPEGRAVSTLRLDWQNDAGKEGDPYDFLRTASTSQEGMYGDWLRVLLPADAELLGAAGQAQVPISGAEEITTEAGRASVGNFLLIPPGAASMTYQWTTPGVATLQDDGTWLYRLTIQKQPAHAPEPLTLRVALPEGAEVIAATEGFTVDGGRLAWSSTLTRDLELEIRYRVP
jgi:hypothetical protein